MAICKPDTRKAAHANDWVFGFAAVDCSNDGLNWYTTQCHLLWAARILKQLPPKEYYDHANDKLYNGRPDRIYFVNKNGSAQLKPNAPARYSGSGPASDIGPNWKNGDWSKSYVLLSDHFHVTGCTSYGINDPTNYAKVRAKGQGHLTIDDPNDPLGIELMQLARPLGLSFP